MIPAQVSFGKSRAAPRGHYHRGMFTSPLRRRSEWIALGVAGLAAAALSGCAAQPQTNTNRELLKLRESVAQQERELEARGATIAELNRKLAVATGVDEKQLAYFYYPEKLQIDSLSGGFNDDKQGGDDGVAVYLRPIDRDGDVVKVAGTIRVQLFDLANPPDRNFLGEVTVPVEKSREFWYGKLMTQHYTVKVPFAYPPGHEEVTVRATFVNLFPQRVVTAQQVVKVKLPQ